MRVINSRRIRWTGNVTCISEIITAYILIGRDCLGGLGVMKDKIKIHQRKWA